ncbi:crossover junction endodeoxyribonuclease RuvC [Candidatus Shapirobacteria bacterium]|nr:crossover junction endodeoxyribonuclease RuvC [Candidatus Shapirobacteria bacterium]
MILGIDPGVASTGWAVLDKNKLIASGCIKTSKEDDFSSRLSQIYKEVEEICSRWAVADLAIEEVFFAKNAKTALKVAQVMGAIKAAAQNKGVRVFGYTPLQIKIAVVGYGRAEKKQVELMVGQTINLDQKINSNHAVDALAAALTHQVIFKKND